jgi:menaquinone-dependent protoporphyrinogen oxidase
MEADMRVLVAWGSKAGGTQGIAETIAEALRARGVDVVAEPAASVSGLAGFDAVVIGGAVYANRWHVAARRFVTRNLVALRDIPVWFFSSGPLDASAEGAGIPPVPEVSVLMERVGALGHETFGGRLAADAKGFPASAMAKKHAGDWRDPEHMQAWAESIAARLPTAKPLPAHEPAAGALPRLLAYAVGGAVIASLVAWGLTAVPWAWFAATLHAFAVIGIYAAIGGTYFIARGSRQPVPVAVLFTVVLVALDVILASVLWRDYEMFSHIGQTWLPYVLTLLTTWATGAIVLMIPESEIRKSRAKARTAS